MSNSAIGPAAPLSDESRRARKSGDAIAEFGMVFGDPA